jgi:hypothetical protein
MKQQLLVATCVVMIVALVHLSQVSCAPAKHYNSDLSLLLKHINTILGDLRDKRQCQGYMCSHTHMSAHAGEISAMNALHTFYMQCASDPNCDPNLRRKRHMAFPSDLSLLRSLNEGKSQKS